MYDLKTVVITIGTDHRGYALKEFLKNHQSYGDYKITWEDCGAYDGKRSDYPVFAQCVCENIVEGEALLGILLCGTGSGMAIAANRFSGMYAAVAWNEQVARAVREDDNCNILVIPADFCDKELCLRMVHAWLHAEFKGGRYADRLEML